MVSELCGIELQPSPHSAGGNRANFAKAAGKICRHEPWENTQRSRSDKCQQVVRGKPRLHSSSSSSPGSQSSVQPFALAGWAAMSLQCWAPLSALVLILLFKLYNRYLTFLSAARAEAKVHLGYFHIWTSCIIVRTFRVRNYMNFWSFIEVWRTNK